MFVTNLDTGRVKDVSKALTAPLAEIRESTGLDLAAVIFRERSSAIFKLVTASTGSDDFPILDSETVSFDTPLPCRTSRHVPRMRLSSSVRPIGVDVVDALLCPWQHHTGIAWMIVGNIGAPRGVPARRHGEAARWAERVRGIYGTGVDRGSKNLRTTLRHAFDRIASAEGRHDSDNLLRAVVGVARWVLATSSSYLALPSPTPGKFVFTAAARVRTGQFKKLALGSDEGIGGLTRREKRSISTIDYNADPRLQHGPLLETRAEGFKSAACTPLWTEGRLSGLLYVAERNFRAFNDQEIGLLEELAGYASEVVSQDERRRHRDDALRQDERNRLAVMLHDQVIPHLLETGLTARLSRDLAGPQTREVFDTIGQKAQSCLDSIRACVANITEPDQRGPVTLRGLMSELRSTGETSRIRREVVLNTVDDTPNFLPRTVAAALRTIGREALSNAERHSQGKLVLVRVERTLHQIQLSIDDDGRSMPFEQFATMLDRPGHLGLQRMRSVAHAAGGACRFQRSPTGGLRVLASLPIQQRAPGKAAEQ